MKITTLDTHGFMAAMHAMRNPMNSWDRADTWMELSMADRDKDGEETPIFKLFNNEGVHIGENDKTLSMKLQKAGPEHCKHLRMILCWVDIEAPRYWWQEFDTYRNGVEKVSCSTMHKLTSRPITDSDFETDENNAYSWINVKFNVSVLNDILKEYNETEDPEKKSRLWRALIQSLPQSYIQKRTVMMSYAALRNIVRQREGHKLREWKTFIDWARTLPESWMIFDE